jgi:hypothetical protein
MNRKPPAPVCKVFLVCRQIVGETLTLAKGSCHVNHRFPSARPLAFFARLTGGHGPYLLEIQLQDGSGAVLWRDGPPEPWTPDSPLKTLDVTFNLLPVFPAPGDYVLVLTANEEEVAREPFSARLASQIAGT